MCSGDTVFIPLPPSSNHKDDQVQNDGQEKVEHALPEKPNASGSSKNTRPQGKESQPFARRDVRAGMGLATPNEATAYVLQMMWHFTEPIGVAHLKEWQVSDFHYL